MLKILLEIIKLFLGNSKSIADEAEKVMDSKPPASLAFNTSSVHSDTSSVHSDTSSVHSDTSSVHSDTSPVHSDTSSVHSDTGSVHKNLVSVEEILMGRIKFEALPTDHQENVKELVEKINKFFDGYEWPKQLPKKVNDGYRRPQDAPKNGSPTSWHYKGAAIDLDDDSSGVTWKYVWANRFKLKELGLYVEHPCWTNHKGGSWIHIQTRPPRSGKRFFIPSIQPNPNPSFWDGKYEAELNS